MYSEHLYPTVDAVLDFDYLDLGLVDGGTVYTLPIGPNLQGRPYQTPGSPQGGSTYTMPASSWGTDEVTVKATPLVPSGPKDHAFLDFLKGFTDTGFRF